jgi:hypothetical protein
MFIEQPPPQRHRRFLEDILHLDVLILLLIRRSDITLRYGSVICRLGQGRHHVLILGLKRPVIGKRARTVQDGNLLQTLANVCLGLRDPPTECLDGPVLVL